MIKNKRAFKVKGFQLAIFTDKKIKEAWKESKFKLKLLNKDRAMLKILFKMKVEGLTLLMLKDNQYQTKEFKKHKSKFPKSKIL
jgi:hypothetical protein